ncbi:MAG: peptidyl-tRNA hydrolase [Euryarchaeota archaeon]|nr:peptidyl-tRNA hydrolase [Euryarchaeota archaeon]
MEYKQVIVVRDDLGMTRGKACAQVAHASLGAAEVAMKEHAAWYEAWRRSGQKKVVVRGESQEHLGRLFEEAKRLGLPCFLVRDAGLTQLPPGTTTALAVGPAPGEMVDRVTGELRLF